MFKIVLLKMETCSLTSNSVSANSQSSLYHQSSLGKNVMQLSRKEVDKKYFNQTFIKLFGGGNGGEERHVLQSPLPH